MEQKLILVQIGKTTILVRVLDTVKIKNSNEDSARKSSSHITGCRPFACSVWDQNSNAALNRYTWL